jgi:saposin
LQPVLKNVEVVHESDIGVMKPTDDLPCEFCEQLVIHLRDVLIANTTEEEFEEILKGLCKQTGSFKDEVSTHLTKICCTN